MLHNCKLRANFYDINQYHRESSEKKTFIRIRLNYLQCLRALITCTYVLALLSFPPYYSPHDVTPPSIDRACHRVPSHSGPRNPGLLSSSARLLCDALYLFLCSSHTRLDSRTHRIARGISGRVRFNLAYSRSRERVAQPPPASRSAYITRRFRSLAFSRARRSVTLASQFNGGFRGRGERMMVNGG